MPITKRWYLGTSNYDPVSRARPDDDIENERHSVRVLVTGGAGFIGSHLVEQLIKREDQVVVLDDLSTGSVENLRHAQSICDFEVVEGSVTDELLVDSLVQECDAILHMAAAVGVKLVMDRPLESFQTNVRGTEVVVEAADRHSVKVLVASTSEVYGKNRSGVFSEDSDFVYGPTSVTRWTYALSKATDEVIAYYYFLEKGLSTVIFRLFNTVGPRQSGDFGMVLPRFVRQALSGAPLTVHGNGTQKRCFCHVEDAVRGILSLLDEPRAIGGTFNIGSTEEISIIDAAKRVIEETGSSSEIQLIDYLDVYGTGFEDIPRRVPDISKISNLTGWKPTREMDYIIQSVIESVSSELVL